MPITLPIRQLGDPLPLPPLNFPPGMSVPLTLPKGQVCSYLLNISPFACCTSKSRFLHLCILAQPVKGLFHPPPPYGLAINGPHQSGQCNNVNLANHRSHPSFRVWPPYISPPPLASCPRPPQGISSGSLSPGDLVFSLLGHSKLAPS